jgi:flagellar motor component MotA
MSDQKNLRRRAMTLMLRKSIFSWQVLVTVVFTLLLFTAGPQPFEFWEPFFWLIAGGVTIGAFVLSNLNDPSMANEAMASLFEQQFDISQIKNRVSQQRLRDAIEYRENMAMLASRAEGAMRLQLQQTVDDIDDWIAHMYDLAQHIDSFESNELVARDRKTVPTQLEKACFRMEREENPQVRRELERQVNQLEQQLINLEATVNTMRRAEIQLESTLSSLGTIYAQMSRLGAKEVDSGRAQRLRLEIQDEVSSLQDTIEAMDEVQAQSLRLS